MDEIEIPPEILADAQGRMDAEWEFYTRLGELSEGSENWTLQPHHDTSSRAAFQSAMTLESAIEACAMLRLYASIVGLERTSTWSMSALPSLHSRPGLQRFSTVSTGSVELFFVRLDLDEDTVVSWGLRLDSPVEVLPWFETKLTPTGDFYLFGVALEDLLLALSDPTIHDAVLATRVRREHARRGSWHNPHLAAYVVPDQTDANALAHLATPLTEDEEVERRYVARVVQARAHQRRFRELLVASYPPCCAYCGLDIPEILEAAHIVADAEGGAASVANGRLLCPNHHRGFDAGLLRWNGAAFVPDEGARLVPPSPL